jgi:hypothetical protein
VARLKTISEFKSTLAGGGARPNLFEVELTTFPDPQLLDGMLIHFSIFVRQQIYLLLLLLVLMFHLEEEHSKLLETDLLMFGL